MAGLLATRFAWRAPVPPSVIPMTRLRPGEKWEFRGLKLDSLAEFGQARLRGNDMAGKAKCSYEGRTNS